MKTQFRRHRDAASNDSYRRRRAEVLERLDLREVLLEQGFTLHGKRLTPPGATHMAHDCGNILPDGMAIYLHCNCFERLGLKPTRKGKQVANAIDLLSLRHGGDNSAAWREACERAGVTEGGSGYRPLVKRPVRLPAPPEPVTPAAPPAPELRLKSLDDLRAAKGWILMTADKKPAPALDGRSRYQQSVAGAPLRLARYGGVHPEYGYPLLAWQDWHTVASQAAASDRDLRPAFCLSGDAATPPVSDLAVIDVDYTPELDTGSVWRAQRDLLVRLLEARGGLALPSSSGQGRHILLTWEGPGLPADSRVLLEAPASGADGRGRRPLVAEFFAPGTRRSVALMLQKAPPDARLTLYNRDSLYAALERPPEG